MMMMMMEEVVQEDHQSQVLGSKDISQIIKGKRTKRQRPLSPLALTMAVSTSSAEAITSNYSSPTTSTNYGLTEISTSTTTTTEEEEDMANCLILLAQGHLTPRKKPNTQKVLFQSDQKPAENNISAIDKSTGGAITSTGLFVYQCKTCDRCFSSFQALGGHRASHKKPKVNPDGNNNNKKGLLSFTEEENIIGHRSFDHQNSTSTDLSLQISNRIGLSYSNKTIAINKPKVHECSICGAEFTSGQALGGHMRRHRSFINTQTTAATTTSLSLVSSSPESHELKKSKNVLKLDLNLPAPEDDRRENKFPFAGKEQVIVFSHASPLVDCHY